MLMMQLAAVLREVWNAAMKRLNVSIVMPHLHAIDRVVAGVSKAPPRQPLTFMKTPTGGPI